MSSQTPSLARYPNDSLCETAKVALTSNNILHFHFAISDQIILFYFL